MLIKIQISLMSVFYFRCCFGNSVPVTPLWLVFWCSWSSAWYVETAVCNFFILKYYFLMLLLVSSGDPVRSHFVWVSLASSIKPSVSICIERVSD